MQPPARPEPEIRFLRDGAGRSIAYAVSGSGPVVICPPWWISHLRRDWEDPAFRTFFTRLGEGLTLVRYDRAGVGLSDRGTIASSLDEEVTLLDTVATQIGADRYGLFAMSCGGPIAIRHAADHPEKVARMVFYGSFIDGSDLGTEAQRAAFR